MDTSIQTNIIFTILGGLVGFPSKAFFIRSLQIGKAGRVTTLSSLSVVFSLICEVFYLSEYPPWPGIFGSLPVIASAIFLYLKKECAKKA
jgi:uncharacterized membrane protein